MHDSSIGCVIGNVVTETSKNVNLLGRCPALPEMGIAERFFPCDTVPHPGEALSLANLFEVRRILETVHMTSDASRRVE